MWCLNTESVLSLIMYSRISVVRGIHTGLVDIEFLRTLGLR